MIDAPNVIARPPQNIDELAFTFKRNAALASENFHCPPGEPESAKGVDH
jgi:hypothetical protein